MKRRTFLVAGPAGAAAVFAAACGHDTPSRQDEPAVDMEESEDAVLTALGAVPSLVDGLARQPGADRQYYVRDASGKVIAFKMGFHQNHEGDVQFAFTRKDGKRAFVDFGLLSGLRILDERGNEISTGSAVVMGTLSTKPAQGLDPEQWMRNGIAVAGAALAAWLGLSAFQFVAAGLGTIAIAGLVIG
ncbi:MAG: hypothetical protein AAB671_00385, partial [Patescibacteria group bacterium]